MRRMQAKKAANPTGFFSQLGDAQTILHCLVEVRSLQLCPALHALHEGRIAAAARALGELLERTVQILVNTVSFARVGAFALAHAGLSAAVVALAQATGSATGEIAALVVGNVLILVLEGLVVGIQTTRLILFEFFVRFFESRGREFRPLLPPHVTEAHS